MKFKGRALLAMFLLVLQPINILETGVSKDSVYLEQQSANSCTLCASAMMIRSTMRKCEDTDWQTITEDAISQYAWTEQGLRWSWKWTDNKNSVSVNHEPRNGMEEDKLKAILQEHPEGIVLYCGGQIHHGVFLTDWEDSVFYCADPAVGYAGERIPINKSLLGTRVGEQEKILECVTAYWYVDSIDIKQVTNDFQQPLKALEYGARQ